MASKALAPPLSYSPALPSEGNTPVLEKESFVGDDKLQIDIEAASPKTPTSKTALNRHHAPVVGHAIRTQKWLTRTKLGQTTLWLGMTLLIMISILASYYSYYNQLGVDGSQSLLQGVDAEDHPNNTTYIQLVGQVTAIDTVALVLTVSWSVNATGFDNATGVTIGIYQDNMKTAVGSYSVDADAAFITQSFTTKLNLLGVTDNRAKSTSEPSSVRYPFDEYSTFPTFAANASTGEWVAIYDATITGNVQGYSIITSDGASPYPGLPDSNDSVALARYIYIQVGRAVAIQAFVVLLAMIMWFISLLVLWLTVLGTIYGYSLPSNFLGVPATILFAIPGIRSAMPNAPPFGTYLDLCSFLLCELIVALSFVAFNVTYAKRMHFDRFHKKE